MEKLNRVMCKIAIKDLQKNIDAIGGIVKATSKGFTNNEDIKQIKKNTTKLLNFQQKILDNCK